MARTGKFGQRPRVQASVTNTLVAWAREFQNQRAQNIMDAWMKGGMFEGQKATDDVVLKFWKGKLKGVSKDDPLADTYKNTVTQLDYSIKESKMTAAYAQGPRDEAADAKMVKFYMDWSKKVPKNSEFYRVLLRDAGQYMRNAKATSDAERKRREEERYQRLQNSTRQQKEAAGEYTIDLLRRIAQSGNVSGGIIPAIDAPGSGSDLTDFDPNDPGTMLRLIDAVSGPKFTVSGSKGEETTKVSEREWGTTQVLFHDDDGRPWTGRAVLAEIAKLDPSFKPGAPFDVNFVTKLLDRQMQGLNERIARANKTGHMTDVVQLQKSKSYVALLNREVAAYPVQKAYQEARADYDAVTDDPSASPQAIMNAWNTYSAALTRMANDPRIETDDNFRARLMAEVNGDAGVPSLNESFTGLSGANGQEGVKDIAINTENIERIQQDIEMVASGAAVWTLGEIDSNGLFQPKAGGRTIGPGTLDGIEAGGENPVTITVPDPRGGPALKMTVTAIPVYATAKSPIDGSPISTTNSQPIAYAYNIPKGSGYTTQYGFETNKGFVFSEDPPWDENLPTVASSKDGNHLEVDLTPELAKAGYGTDPRTGAPTRAPDMTKDDLTGAAVGVPGFQVQGVTLGKDGKPKGGTLVFDPQTAAWTTDTRSALGFGQTDPATDFKSLTLSLLMSTQDGRNIAGTLDKNKAFAAQIEDDNHRAAGYVFDPKTLQWTPGPNADPGALSYNQRQTAIATTKTGYLDFAIGARDMWSRETTGSPYNKTAQIGGMSIDERDERAKRLPSDQVAGTPFEPLGTAWKASMNVLKGMSDRQKDDFAIKPVGTLKVPTYEPPKTNPAVTPKPPAYTPPGQTSSVPPPTYPGQTSSVPPPTYSLPPPSSPLWNDERGNQG